MPISLQLQVLTILKEMCLSSLQYNVCTNIGTIMYIQTLISSCRAMCFSYNTNCEHTIKYATSLVLKNLNFHSQQAWLAIIYFHEQFYFHLSGRYLGALFAFLSRDSRGSLCTLKHTLIIWGRTWEPHSLIIYDLSSSPYKNVSSKGHKGRFVAVDWIRK